MHVLTSILHVLHLVCVYYTEINVIIYKYMQLEGRSIKGYPLKVMNNLYSVFGNV